MSIDTSGLFGWCSPDVVESAAPAISKSGDGYLQTVESARDTWQQLGGHYSGDGAAEILAVFSSVMPNAQMLAESAKVASDALMAFASGIRALEVRRHQLMARVEAADRRAAQDQEAQCMADPVSPPYPAATADLLLPAKSAEVHSLSSHQASPLPTSGKMPTTNFSRLIPG
ncbi:WXG100 family type VII secretion target [Arthrobacter sp.]|uniref:WXG100 family type VII secretion target n=1 Tax=Arthrobacter sp. TaxID=1667 RepID=UPI00289AC7C5|nr:WXG100 family type VII secretion target [Arthrobacter sp.]